MKEANSSLQAFHIVTQTDILHMLQNFITLYNWKLWSKVDALAFPSHVYFCSLFNVFLV